MILIQKSKRMLNVIDQIGNHVKNCNECRVEHIVSLLANSPDANDCVTVSGEFQEDLAMPFTFVMLYAYSQILNSDEIDKEIENIKNQLVSELVKYLGINS